MYLTRTEENVAGVDALAARLAPSGGGRVGLAALLDDLPHRARRTLAPGLGVRRALAWERSDRHDRTWFPQGVTNSYATDTDREVLLVAWYSSRGAGARVSFLDLAARRYRHVLLVEPTEDGDVRPVKVHAGGLVWQGPWLHVASTWRGLLTCRVEDVMLDPTEEHGYRYLLPVRFGYQAATDEGVARLRYSFLSLDRSGPEPALVAGEYGADGQTTRLARFPTDPATGLPAAGEDGTVRPADLGDAARARMQGGCRVGGVWYVTVSRGRRTPGDVYVGGLGAFTRYRWATPMGPEDLCHHPPTDLLWSVTEHPGRRWVFAMKRGWFR
ncbi:hypothetical protein [Nocardioides sp.]|uniref:hypothetical protein n=1 Tax=Nocardioides sp. TaxID=35761 RepID=UPI0039E43322